MVNELQVLRLADLAEVYDGPHATPTKTDQGPWYLSISSLKSGNVDLAQSAHLSEDDFAQWTRRVRPQPGDTLFSYETRLGEAGHWSNGARAALGRRMALLRPKTGVVDPRFLTYAYLGPQFQSEIARRTIRGATVDRIPVAEIGRWPITAPTVEEQRRIAGVLGALDDLVDCNRRIAEDCTALSRALVRATFADATKTAPLSDLAEFVNGKNFTKGAVGLGRPVIRTPEVRRGPQAGTARSDADAADENIAREGDTLFVWSGSLTVGRWLWEEGLINQHVFNVLPKPGVPAWLVFALIEYQMPWFLSLASDKATTMGHIKREHLDAVVPIPSSTQSERLGAIIEPLWNEALECGVAIQQFTRTRDELLPLLLSGQVRVNAVTESLVG